MRGKDPGSTKDRVTASRRSYRFLTPKLRSPISVYGAGRVFGGGGFRAGAVEDIVRRNMDEGNVHLGAYASHCGGGIRIYYPGQRLFFFGLVNRRVSCGIDYGCGCMAANGGRAGRGVRKVRL